MKKFILLIALSVLLYSAPGYTGKRRKHFTTAASKANTRLQKAESKAARKAARAAAEKAAALAAEVAAADARRTAADAEWAAWQGPVSRPKCRGGIISGFTPWGDPETIYFEWKHPADFEAQQEQCKKQLPEATERRERQLAEATERRERQLAEALRKDVDGQSALEDAQDKHLFPQEVGKAEGAAAAEELAAERREVAEKRAEIGAVAAEEAAAMDAWLALRARKREREEAEKAEAVRAPASAPDEVV